MGYLALAGLVMLLGLCHGQAQRETEETWEFDSDYARDLRTRR